MNDILRCLDSEGHPNAFEMPGADGGAYSASRRLLEHVDRRNGTAVGSFSIVDGDLREGIEFEVGDGERGGIIVFSTDVNSLKSSDNAVVDKLKKFFKTWHNRWTADRKLDGVARKHGLIGWTVGRNLRGRYTGRNGKTFDENSLSVEVVGVDFDKLIKVAEDLCKEFEQESVLVKAYDGNRMLFVNSLKESADRDDDYRQYEIVDSGDHLGVHYYIAFDRDENDYGYAVEGEPAYEDVDYESFTWCGSLQDAREMAVDYIEENAVDVDYDRHQERSDESNDNAGDGKKTGGTATDASDALRKEIEKAYAEAKQHKDGRYAFDLDLPDGRRAHGIIYRLRGASGGPTVRIGVTVGDCFVSRDCRSEDEAGDCITWLVNAVGECVAWPVNKGRVGEGAERASELHSLGESASCDGLSKAVEAAGFKVESCSQDGDRGYNLVVSERLGKDDLKKVTDAVTGAVEGCKVLFPDLAEMRTVYVAVEGKKVDEAAGGRKVNEAADAPLEPLGTAYVAFKVPSFAVEHFGKEPFVSKGCRTGKDGEVYHVVQLSTYGDFKSFFGNAGFLVEDGAGFLLGIYSDLQKQALKDGREQCPYKDSDFTDEIEVLMMK